MLLPEDFDGKISCTKCQGDKQFCVACLEFDRFQIFRGVYLKDIYDMYVTGSENMQRGGLLDGSN